MIFWSHSHEIPEGRFAIPPRRLGPAVSTMTSRRGRCLAAVSLHLNLKEITMQWIDPAFCDIRLGFEVTAYVYVR
jgi:pyrroloquinoline quinone biosynthesis protein A